MSDTVEVDEEELNRVCWVVIHTKESHREHGKRAKNCIEAIEHDEDTSSLDEQDKSWEYGYHSGHYNGYADVESQLETLGIDVRDRAEQCAVAKDLPLEQL